MNWFALLNVVGCGGACIQSFLNKNYPMTVVWGSYAIATAALIYMEFKVHD